MQTERHCETWRAVRCGLLALGTTTAAAPAAVDLSGYTIDSGGGYSAAGTIELAGSIGQPDAGVLAHGTIELSGGFWQPLTAVPTACPGDADGNGRVDIDDLLTVLGLFGDPGPGSPGDADGDGDTDADDLHEVIVNFGAPCG